MTDPETRYPEGRGAALWRAALARWLDRPAPRTHHSEPEGKDQGEKSQ
jgi:hypothetical protein